MYEFSKKNLSIKETFSSIFDLYCTTFPKIWKWVLLLMCIFPAVALMIVPFLPSLGEGMDESAKTVFLSFIITLTIAGNLLWFYIHLFLLHRIQNLGSSTEKTVKDSFKFAFKIFPKAFVVGVFASLIIFSPGIIAFGLQYLSEQSTMLMSSRFLLAIQVIFFFVMSIYLFFSVALAVLKKDRVINAITHSFYLVRENYWRTLGLFVLFMLLTIGLASIFLLIELAVGFIVGLIFGEAKVLLGILSELFQLAFFTIFTPLPVCLVLVQLNNLLISKKEEGFFVKVVKAKK